GWGFLRPGDKPVTALGDGLNVTRFGRVVPQHLPQFVYVLREASFLDEAAAPHLFQKLLLLDYLYRVLDEQQQSLKSLWGQTDIDAVFEQDSTACIEHEP